MTTVRPRGALGIAVVATLLCACTAAPGAFPARSGGLGRPGEPAAQPSAAPSIAPSPSPRPTAIAAPTPTPSSGPTVALESGPAVTPPAVRAATVEILFEAAAGPPPRTSDGPGAGALEPVIAAHPTDPGILALAYARALTPVGDSIGISARVRISPDGGRTWRETKRHPCDGSGRWPSLHSAVAWGPGPKGAARLWWAGTTVARGDGVRVGIAWSDDLGASWSRLHVVRDTPAWVGGFPDVTVDADPASPGYGNAYVVYAYPAPKGRGASIRLLASGDLGRSWHGTDVARAPAEAGFPVSWRFGSRIRTGPDGAIYVSTWQADLRSWDATDPFDRGGPKNVGRVGFAVARLTFERDRGRFSASPAVMAATLERNAWTTGRQVAPGTRSHTYLDPMWSHGLAVDPDSGRVLLVVGDVSARPTGDAGRGTVRVGRSDDAGLTWAWVTIPRAPSVDRIAQSSFRPTLAIAGDVVFVGLHTIDDTALAKAWAIDARMGNAFSVSRDGGHAFSVPAPVTTDRWRASALERAVNGPGLRDRVDVTADGQFAYAYADGRTAPARPTRSAGQRQVYVALLAIEGGRPPVAPGDRER